MIDESLWHCWNVCQMKNEGQIGCNVCPMNFVYVCFLIKKTSEVNNVMTIIIVFY